MTSCGFRFLFIAKKYVSTISFIYHQLNSPAWVVLDHFAPLSPSHTSRTCYCQAPACCARRFPAPSPSWQCLGVQDTVQPACFRLHYKKPICCPANPSNASEAAVMCCECPGSAPSPFFSPLRKTKGERAAKAVKHISYDLISSIYDFVIQVSGLENGSAHGLVL